MSAVVIEHVKVDDLPEAWRARLPAAHGACVTVRIEEELQDQAPGAEDPENPLFGMWRGREETMGVQAYVRRMREPRF